MLKVRNKQLSFGSRTFIMGIVNVTPDSFSGDGVLDLNTAVNFALKQIADGADIIDIGGQSTRPGHTPIDPEEESSRILPVIAALRKVSDVIISVDTFNSLVLEKAVAAGADILNSIWGLNNSLNDSLLNSIKHKPMPIVIMHNKSEPVYPHGVIEEVVEQLHSQAKKALVLGLSPEQIILDPGIGFGKTADQNLAVLSSLQKLSACGFPVLIGTSRKSTIGKIIDRPVDERDFGTAATIALAIANGVDFVRVHNVRDMIDVVKISDALVRDWRPQNWQA